MKKLLSLLLCLAVGAQSQASFRDELPFTKKEVIGFSAFTGGLYTIKYLKLNSFSTLVLSLGLSVGWIKYMKNIDCQKTTAEATTAPYISEDMATFEDSMPPTADIYFVPYLNYEILQKVVTDFSFVKTYLNKDIFMIDCPICLDTDEAQPKESIAVLPCGHILCKQCFDDMKATNNTFDCSECRRPASSCKTVHEYINDSWAAKLIEDTYPDPVPSAPPAEYFDDPAPSAPPATHFYPEIPA